MLLRPGITRCPACGRFVYAIDDLFTVHPSDELAAAAPAFTPGIYHHACFRGHPSRDAVLGVYTRAGREAWPADTEFLTTLARGPDFALTLRPGTGEYTLRFITRGRQLSLPAAGWAEFRGLLTRPDGPPATPLGSRDGFRILRTPNGWELATRRLVPIDAEFAPADFARLRQHLTGRGVDPSRTPVEVGAVCRQLGIVLGEADCPPDRLTGTFAWPAAPADPAAPVTLTVQVEAWHTVSLTDAEMGELRTFLQSLRQQSG